MPEGTGQVLRGGPGSQRVRTPARCPAAAARTRPGVHSARDGSVRTTHSCGDSTERTPQQPGTKPGPRTTDVYCFLSGSLGSPRSRFQRGSLPERPLLCLHRRTESTRPLVAETPVLCDQGPTLCPLLSLITSFLCKSHWRGASTQESGGH